MCGGAARGSPAEGAVALQTVPLGDRLGVFPDNAMQFVKGVFEEEVGQKVVMAYQPARRTQDVPKSGQVENLLACPDVGRRHGCPQCIGEPRWLAIANSRGAVRLRLVSHRQGWAFPRWSEVLFEGPGRICGLERPGYRLNAHR